ncbi:rhodanese-like domain-containing protein [Shewanella sp.]|uniref:rhodanese-like domain-containing protein n=1 Tax=Shewanella sp. TaxID=50422 RepID=UPI004047EF0C
MLNISMLKTIKAMLTVLLIVSSSAAIPVFANEQQGQIAWQKINGNATLIDVRTAEEFTAGHIEGAINIPFEHIVAELAKLNIAKDTEVVLYCRSGRRSGIAQNALIEQGYTATFNAGGLDTLMSTR